jgi:hypothetical protein
MEDYTVMLFSPHSLHAPVIQSDVHKNEVRLKLQTFADRQRKLMAGAAPAVPIPTVVIPLTTVSLLGNFDAYINIQFRGPTPGPLTPLIVDSGNSNLIVPFWEAIKDLPGYTVIGEAKEPWGSPAKVVRGPIEIPMESGAVHVLEDCVFFACTDAPRTANFGAARVTPWSSNGWNTPQGLGVTLQAPLSYNSQYPYAEFNYAATANLLASGDTMKVAQASQLILSQSLPSGYSLFNALENLEWMSLIPKSLTVGNTATPWPGDVQSPIAVIDTGGGPLFLSDPNGYVHASAWPHPATCPKWASSSEQCNCISDDLTIELSGADQSSSYRYKLHTSDLPASVQGLTAVMCKKMWYMMGQQGMNIGGVSALFNNILIDYANSHVGLKPK